MEQKTLRNPMKWHMEQMKRIRPSMSFDAMQDFETQKRALRNKLEELIQIPPRDGACVPVIEYEDDFARYI